jgi:tetratricopeptide (TPR) repeat protein
LLVLEDLHWADDTALAWLHYLVRRTAQTPVLLLVTYRLEDIAPDHALLGLELELEREGRAVRFKLGHLAREALARWMVGASDGLVSIVYRRSEGNPFFALETLRSFFEEKKVQLVDGQWVEDVDVASLSVPTSIRQIVRQRVERLSEPAREMLSIAAVIGRTFDLDVLEQVWKQDEETLLKTLDDLLRAHLVHEKELWPDDYAFDHHLVRAAIYDDLHYRRRRRLHRLVAEVMAASCAARPGKFGDVAYHFERAGETERALDWLVKAGEQAARVYKPRQALVYFRRAVAALERSRTDALAARALTGLAAAHLGVLGAGQDVWRWLERALAIWKEIDDQAGVARACYDLAYRHADFEQARALVQRGIEAVKGREGLEAETARGYGLLARFYEHEGRFVDAQDWSERQRDVSEHIQDQEGLAHAHHRLGSLMWRIGGPLGEAVAHEKEAARLAQDLGWLDFAAGSRNIAGYCLLAMGCTVEAEQSCREALDLSVEMNVPWRQCWAFHGLADIFTLRGEWKEAERLLDQAEETMVYSSTRFQEIVLLRARGQLAARRGDLKAARPLLEVALEISRDFYRRYVPELELELIALSLKGKCGPDVQGRLEQIRTWVVQSGIEGMLARADRLNGRVVAFDDDPSAAEESFAASLRRFEALQQFVEAARTRLVWGEMLLAHDAVRARALLADALAIFVAAEARPETEAVRRLLA